MLVLTVSRQLCTVVVANFQDDEQLVRKGDGKALGDGFEAKDLATAATQGTLLTLSLELKKDISVVRAILDKNVGAAKLEDVARRLPLSVAAQSGCSSDVVELVRLAHLDVPHELKDLVLATKNQQLEQQV